MRRKNWNWLGLFDCQKSFKKKIEEMSPSRKDDITVQHEEKLKTEAGTFLQECGKQLKLPQIAIATALVYFHRFYLVNSFKKTDRYVSKSLLKNFFLLNIRNCIYFVSYWLKKMVSVSCIFLAGKVEEYPQKLKDTIWTYLKCLPARNKRFELPPNKETFFASQVCTKKEI